MRKLFSTIFILFIILFGSINIKADPWGTDLGSFNGIHCYSNGPGNNCIGSNCWNYYNGTNTGLKWECVEYVCRYFLIHYNHNIRISGNAIDYYQNAPNVNRYAYGSTTAPAVGDILCFSGGNPNYGHVAIIREVGATYLKVIQQNVTQNSGDANYNISMTVTGGHYYVNGSSIGSSYTCQGWLRQPSSSTITTSFKFNSTELPPPPNEWKLWKTPPIPGNFYTLTVTVTGRPSGSDGYWDLFLYRPNGDSIDAALNVQTDVVNQGFSVNVSNNWFPDGGNYKFKVMNRTNTGIPRTIWAVSQPFYISKVPILTIDNISNLTVGQQTTFTWHITGGIPGLANGGWIGNIQIQWYKDTTALNVLATPLVSSSPYSFTVTNTGGPIPGCNYRLSGSNPSGTSIPPGYVYAFSNYFCVTNPTSIVLINDHIPTEFNLSDNYPNPFNPKTNIEFALPKKVFVKIVIYDILGNEIQNIVKEELNAGTYQVDFDGTNLASGLYYFKLTADNYQETKKMILIK